MTDIMTERAGDAQGVVEPLLRVENLTTAFRIGEVDIKAVNNLSFDLRAGRVLGIVGELGSGKSVTARSLMGMLRSPGRVEAGRVLFAGADLLGLAERQMEALRGKQIAIVLQDPMASLNPVLRIGDQLVEGIRCHTDAGRADPRIAPQLLREMGLTTPDEAMNRIRISSPGGCASASCIAMGFSNSPLLIADEPTTALDVTIQAQILDLLRALNAEFGTAIMLITHDLGVVADLCDDLLVMYAGRAVERGAIRDAFERPLHPYTAALLRAVPTLDTPGDEVLNAIPGAPPIPSRLPSGCAFHPRCAFATDKCAREVPPEFEMAPGHRSACWVAAEGQLVVPPPAPSSPHPRLLDLM